MRNCRTIILFNIMYNEYVKLNLHMYYSSLKQYKVVVNIFPNKNRKKYKIR